MSSGILSSQMVCINLFVIGSRRVTEVNGSEVTLETFLVPPAALHLSVCRAREPCSSCSSLYCFFCSRVATIKRCWRRAGGLCSAANHPVDFIAQFKDQSLAHLLPLYSNACRAAYVSVLQMSSSSKYGVEGIQCSASYSSTAVRYSRMAAWMFSRASASECALRPATR